jgi:hypothetical protein
MSRRGVAAAVAPLSLAGVLGTDARTECQKIGYQAVEFLRSSSMGNGLYHPG